ncbi:Uncharacterised protein [Algoriella xinjiangensis]|uniref:hypothetical protein n=1 Tax=Algoriella xinjiangensis TaxID=684065 RepID=UPI000F635C47|nr:hypothetical protein [Algoriella xinjiangensis]VDH16763.1 Uncharacterised protein [Algoriella xinjiangensis]
MGDSLVYENNQVALSDDFIQVSSSNLPHAIVTEVLLKNGKRTQIMTLFNQNEINFEEIEIGVESGLKHNRETLTCKSSFCTGVKQGLLRVITSSQWKNIKHYLSQK